MADVEFDAFEGDGATYPSTDPGLAAALVNWTGALISVGLLAGLAVWGYKLTMRDVTDVPVIRALEGPMRVQPEDPGGTQAAHQGLSVNRVQADGGVEAPADTLVLAPQPIDLFAATPKPEADRAGGVTPQADLGGATELASSGADTDGLAPAPAAEPEKSAMAEGVEAALALADVVPEDVDPLPEVKSHLTKIVPLSVPGVKRTRLPLPRPEGAYDAAVAVRQAAAEAAPVAAAVDLDPASLVPGMRLVQLGAFDSPDQARSEWDGFTRRYATYMEGKKRVIQEAKSGGRTFYRLRVAGFEGLSDARRFCTVILADGGACIPVNHR